VIAPILNTAAAYYKGGCLKTKWLSVTRSAFLVLKQNLRNEHGRLFNRLKGVVKYMERLSAAYRLVEMSQFLLLVHNFY
jgi:hypothetical protein